MDHPALPILLHRLPPELRVQIFGHAFNPEGAREIITIAKSATATSSAPKLDLCLKDQHKMEYLRQFEQRKLWLNPKLVGHQLAFEAAEALYASKFMFAVKAEDLEDFLGECPLTGFPNPRRLISCLHFYVDEEPNFTGEGKNYQALRVADWVDLHPTTATPKQTRANRHALLMRQCWRNILLMPRLRNVECRVLPVGGRLEVPDVRGCEIRDMLPSLFRLFNKGVAVRLYLRAWTKIEDDFPLPYRRTPDPVDPSKFESPMDLDVFLPFGGHRVRVPHNIGSSRKSKTEMTLPLECMWPGPGVIPRNPGVRAVLDAATQARCRASLYYALEELFSRLLGNHGYEVLQGDLIKPQNVLSTPRASTPLTPNVCTTSNILCFETVVNALSSQATCGEHKDAAKRGRLSRKAVGMEQTTTLKLSSSNGCRRKGK